MIGKIDIKRQLISKIHITFPSTLTVIKAVTLGLILLASESLGNVSRLSSDVSCLNRKKDLRLKVK